MDDQAKSREELLEELMALRASVSRPEPGDGKIPPRPPPWVARIPETIADSLFVLDLDWRFVYLNDQALRDARQTADDLLGRSLWEKFPGLLATSLEGNYRRAMAEQTPVHFEMRGLLSGRWLEVHAFPAPTAWSPTAGTPPTGTGWRSSFARCKRWRRSGSWPAAWPMTSTTC